MGPAAKGQFWLLLSELEISPGPNEETGFAGCPPRVAVGQRSVPALRGLSVPDSSIFSSPQLWLPRLPSEDPGTQPRRPGKSAPPGRMDEESLQTALRTYDAQLQQVELALGAGLDPSELADLRQLQGDLKELIELTEASLVSVRKSKLLAALDGERPAQEDAEPLALQNAIAETAEVPVAPGAELETVPSRETGPGPTEPGQEEDDGEDEEGGAALSGRKVNAPYYSAWGTLEYHNAMIVGTEEADDGSPGVRVLYLYPTHKSLKPCSFFLEGKCRFQENCR